MSKVIDGVCHGERDIVIHRYASHLKALGIPFDVAIGFITEAASRCIPPFDLSVAHAKIERAYSRKDPEEQNLASLRDRVAKFQEEKANDV